jgi:CheY-like chemotaxis protein
MAEKHVLVVDDEGAVRDLVAGMLRHLGYTSQTAANATEALRQIETTPFDLVIADLHMPGMPGDQLANEIKRQKPALPFLLITGDQPEGLPPTIDRLLHKPFSLSDLREALSALT